MANLKPNFLLFETEGVERFIIDVNELFHARENFDVDEPLGKKRCTYLHFKCKPEEEFKVQGYHLDRILDAIKDKEL